MQRLLWVHSWCGNSRIWNSNSKSYGTRAIRDTLPRMNSEMGTSPQFETVEYAATPGNCILCNQPISGSYYRVNGEQACSSCVTREGMVTRDNASHYSRALVFGIGAAIVGMIGYAAFEIITGWIIGYVALAVGWLVGKAMMTGSKGFGGRKYQITAALLTYAAVSLAAIPLVFSQIAKQKEQNPVQIQQQQTAQQPALDTAPLFSDGGTSAATTSEGKELTGLNVTPSGIPTPKAEKPKMGFGKAVGMLMLIGLASPFLELADPFHGLIGLFILFIGIRIAWKMTARPQLQIDGPF